MRVRDKGGEVREVVRRGRRGERSGLRERGEGSPELL